MKKKAVLIIGILALICTPTIFAQVIGPAPAGCLGDDGICNCTESGRCLQTTTCIDEGGICVIATVLRLCVCLTIGDVEPVEGLR